MLILLPTDNNKLLMQWKGPIEVPDKIGATDYRGCVGKTSKLFHVNIFKLYVDRNNCAIGSFMAVVNDEERELMDSLLSMGKQSVVDVHLCEQLTPEQNVQLNVLLQEFSEICSDLPGCTPLISHEIKLTQEKPVRTKPYPVPFANVRQWKRR